jgi:hypothetical protein
MYRTVQRIETGKKSKNERKKKLKLEVIFVDAIMKWPVGMRTKDYVCLFSTALLHQTS